VLTEQHYSMPTRTPRRFDSLAVSARPLVLDQSDTVPPVAAR
jgi:hypothetical protein